MSPAIASSPASGRPRAADGFVERGDRVTRLEAFVDAAFAFALTLLIISIDSIPRSIGDLFEALQGVPSFAAAFAILAMFWRGHATWSRRYGLDDVPTLLLSLALVFLVLVFVYPLKMLAAAFFHWISGERLPASFSVGSEADIVVLYLVYGIAFAALGTVLALLYSHAWRRREVLVLDAEERIRTRLAIASWWILVGVAGLSCALAIALPENPASWALALPGFAYMLLNLMWPVLSAYDRRLRRAQGLPC